MEVGGIRALRRRVDTAVDHRVQWARAIERLRVEHSVEWVDLERMAPMAAP